MATVTIKLTDLETGGIRLELSSDPPVVNQVWPGTEVKMMEGSELTLAQFMGRVAAVSIVDALPNTVVKEAH